MGARGPLRVLHLAGSATDDFLADLSRLYAADCLEATADPARYEPVVAWVSPGGTWRLPASLSRPDLAAAPPLSTGDAASRLAGMTIDVAVPQMFCLPGMTHYRALLDVLGIPYVGNPPDVMAVAADKPRARALVAAAGVDVPAAEVLRPGDAPTLDPPVVVKPADSDNSLGVTLVRERSDYAAAVAGALDVSGRALVERYVPLGREVRCGVVVRDGRAVPLPLEEYAVDEAAHPVRVATDKIGKGGDGDLRLMAKGATAWIVPLEDPVTGPVQRAALACHAALGCRDYSLFDFRVDPDGRPWFLEAGLYCSFARQSVLTVMAAAGGTALPELFADAVAAAMRRPTGVTRRPHGEPHALPSTVTRSS